MGFVGSSATNFPPRVLTSTLPSTTVPATDWPATGVAVGDGIGVGVGVGAAGGFGTWKPLTGGATAPCSYAPASHAPLALRGAKRWSLRLWHGFAKPLAALFAGIGRIAVCPPSSLSPSTSPAFEFSWKPHDVPLSMSSPDDAAATLQFSGVSPTLPTTRDPYDVHCPLTRIPPGF